MSVNVYLSDEVLNLKGFKSNPESEEKMSFNGLSVYKEHSELYLSWDLDTPIPKGIEEFVTRISCHEVILKLGHREAGVYMYESAECKLVPDDMGVRSSKPVYKVRVTGKNLQDIREVLHRVKVGTIRPDESYEGSQLGKSRAKLEEEVATLEANLVLCRAGYAKEFRKNRLVREFIEDLDAGWWPLCFLSKVSSNIKAILTHQVYWWFQRI